MPTDSTIIRDTILSLLARRGPGKSICPSEVARQLWPTNWRPRMDEVRDVALELAKTGKLLITQRGKRVEPPFRGPIRLTLPPE